MLAIPAQVYPYNDSMSQQKIILVAGPTAAGKSALALDLARKTNGTIINADAMQIYDGLPILSAQPSPEELAACPHELYGVLDPAEASSAGKWLELVRPVIQKIIDTGRTPILVGGTGLYFRALMGGLADIPPIPDGVRAETQKLYDQIGEEKFRKLLAERDPASAARIERNDRQRLIRAYEVVAHTEKSLGEWQKKDSGFKVQGTESNAPQGCSSPPPVFTGGVRGGLANSATNQPSLDPSRKNGREALMAEFEPHLLTPPREELYATCDRRFLKMIEQGAVEEVKNFLKRKLDPTLPAMKTIGVREIGAYLKSETTLDDAIAKAQQATRNYAKRQLTWFRNQGLIPTDL